MVFLKKVTCKHELKKLYRGKAVEFKRMVIVPQSEVDNSWFQELSKKEWQGLARTTLPEVEAHLKSNNFFAKYEKLSDLYSLTFEAIKDSSNETQYVFRLVFDHQFFTSTVSVLSLVLAVIALIVSII